MKRQTKLTSQEQEQQVAAQQAEQHAGREFVTPEEMLRHDALHTPVPPTIAHRLQQSLAQIPAPSRGWWRRWFGS
jgi:hypothetical protein